MTATAGTAAVDQVAGAFADRYTPRELVGHPLRAYDPTGVTIKKLDRVQDPGRALRPEGRLGCPPR